ncbi:MAG: hypothetical protein ACO3CH_00415 [Ilumatobacteraceae bacterium]|nr:hypothetical protein [Chitinophagales bacterium]
MAKGKKSSAKGPQQRERYNYIEKKMEVVPGTKAGRKRQRLPLGHPMRTHDLHGPVGKKKIRSVTRNTTDED